MLVGEAAINKFTKLSIHLRAFTVNAVRGRGVVLRGIGEPEIHGIRLY